MVAMDARTTSQSETITVQQEKQSTLGEKVQAVTFATSQQATITKTMQGTKNSTKPSALKKPTKTRRTRIVLALDGGGIRGILTCKVATLQACL